MPDFYKYMMRYGEHGVQAIVENVERSQGIRHETPVPLEHRWNHVMQDTRSEQSSMAA
ncbi:MAG: hypothetical protein WC521_03020 [Bdellovibrionales bacterium]|jgi:hypothetical protein